MFFTLMYVPRKMSLHFKFILFSFLILKKKKFQHNNFSMNPSQKVFKPTAPIKGSFPLDHDAECKEYMMKYMNCLKVNDQSNIKCKIESKEYLDCRMKVGLMEKEDFKKLGFKDDETPLSEKA